ncbi:MAG: TatD family hydrolase [Thermodesulfobacteriota bacterium]|nr:TatD family hydrolase [Thermodesulfobacteriota bacterium]
MIIDSHCHIEAPEFDTDRDDVVARAIENGVLVIISIGTNLAHSKRAIKTASAYQNIYASVGFHPHNAKEIDESAYEEIRKMADHEKVIAYGEIGLDFYRNISPKKIQLKRFREQVILAKELGLPLIIHDRCAHKEVLEILQQESGGVHRGIFHCFPGDYHMAKICIDMGFLISIPGALTYDKTGRYADLIRKIPLDSIVLETDAPYLTPVPYRGKRNEPSYIIYTAQKVAEILGIDSETLGEITTKNFKQVFFLPDSHRG